jgi:electron transfer flavoprotein alpha subunit
MSVLIYAESSDKKLKKVSFELCSYGKALADQMNTNLIALTVNTENAAELAKYGAGEIINVNQADLESFKAASYAELIGKIAMERGAETVLIGSTADSLYLAPLLAANLKSAYASNVVDLPISESPFVVKRKAFSNKAFNFTELSSDYKLLSLAKNSFGIRENAVDAEVSNFDFSPDSKTLAIQIESVEKSTGTVTIADADVVVSAGRGLKNAENWTMVEDLAEVLNAATACSKPVSDLGWRPHSEHVGQTGKQVASNLYIAIGISGAIQHLAGINASKVKVVINTDPEAPFFKAADYGIVGDAFEVVPELITKLKAFKSNN